MSPSGSVTGRKLAEREIWRPVDPWFGRFGGLNAPPETRLTIE